MKNWKVEEMEKWIDENVNKTAPEEAHELNEKVEDLPPHVVLEVLKSVKDEGFRFMSGHYIPAHRLEESFFQDSSPGILSLQRETEVSGEVGVFDPKNSPDFAEICNVWGDYQVRDPASPTVEEEVYIENASRACAKCIGHCCMAFQVPFTIKEIPDRIEVVRMELKRMMVEKMVPGNSQEFLTYKIVDLCDQLYSLEFFKDRLEPVRGLEAEMREHDPHRADRTFSCKAYDQVNNRCSEHGIRPSVCRKYICGPAMAGLVPADRNMTYGVLLKKKADRMKDRDHEQDDPSKEHS